MTGRSPDGSGYSAEPEPSCTVSAVPVSIPNADRQHVMPGDPTGICQMALRWYLHFDFGYPHSVRESNIAVEAFKDGIRTARTLSGHASHCDVNASAIEAQRAETQGGSVEDESAVAKPDAQEKSA